MDFAEYYLWRLSVGVDYSGDFVVVIAMSASAKLIPHASDTSLADRFLQAAQACWGIENNTAVILNSDGSEARMLRWQLQASGVEVFASANSLAAGSFKVIVIDAQGWRCAKVRQQAKAIRMEKPEAAICVVTGLLSSDARPHPSNHPVFDDARAVLQEAGFGFVSIDGASYDNSI